MCTIVLITFLGLFLLGLATSSDAESGPDHRKETTFQYKIVNNSTFLLSERGNGSNVLAVPISSMDVEDLFALYNNLSEFINNGQEVAVKFSDLTVKFHGYYVVNGNLTTPFYISVTKNQSLTIYERIFTEFAKDESIINKLYNYTISPGIDLVVPLMPHLIIPGCENITLKYFNLFRKFNNYNTFYKYIDIVSAIITILGSLLICGCILKRRSLQTPPNVYAFSLAVSVVLQFTINLIRIVFPTEVGSEVTRFWYITAFIIYSTFTVGTFTAAGITIDRYIAICHPSLRCTISTNRRAVQINVAIWALSLLATLIEEVSGLLTHVNKYFFIYSLILFNVLPMCIILLSYIGIGLKLWKSSKARQSFSTDEQPLTEKSINIAAVIAVQYILCWAPYGGFIFLMKIIKPFKYGMFYKFILLEIFILGSLLNPLLYPLVSKDFRKAYKDLTLICIGRIRRRFCYSQRLGESTIALNAIDGENNIVSNET